MVLTTQDRDSRTTPAFAENGKPRTEPSATCPVARRWSRCLAVALTGVVLEAAVALSVREYLGVTRATVPEGYEVKGAPLTTPSDRPNAPRPARRLTLNGIIEPYAQAELHSTLTGTVAWIARQPTPEWAAGLVVQPAFPVPGSGPAEVARLAVQTRLLMEQAQRIDIGSRVRAGDVLLEIAAPELWREVAAKEARVRESQVERDRAALALPSRFRQAEAQKELSRGELKKVEAELAHAEKKFQRISELARRQAVAAELVDEHELLLEAAKAAREGAQAKFRVAEADLETASAAIRTELASKDAAVQAARRELDRARQRAEATRLRAPFDGVITASTVERGYFVHGSPTAPSPALMTVTRLDRVVFVAYVPVSDVPAIRIGAAATVAIDAHSCCQLHGHFSRVSQVIEEASHSMRREIDLENPEGRVKPGTRGTATLMLVQDSHPKEHL